MVGPGLKEAAGKRTPHPVLLHPPGTNLGVNPEPPSQIFDEQLAR